MPLPHTPTLTPAPNLDVGLFEELLGVGRPDELGEHARQRLLVERCPRQGKARTCGQQTCSPYLGGGYSFLGLLLPRGGLLLPGYEKGLCCVYMRIFLIFGPESHRRTLGLGLFIFFSLHPLPRYQDAPCWLVCLNIPITILGTWVE